MKKIITLLVTLAVTSLTQADILAEWVLDDDDLGGTAGALPYSADSVNLLDSATLGHAAAGNVRGGGYWNDTLNYVNIVETNVANAIASANYVSISFSQASGMDLTQFSVLMDASSPTTGYDAFIMSSVDGFTAGNEIWSGNINNSGVIATIDLSGGSYDGLTSIEFRVYAYNAAVSSDRFSLGALGTADGAVDVQLQGIAVPEPATVGMLGLGTLVSLLIRRTRS